MDKKIELNSVYANICKLMAAGYKPLNGNSLLYKYWEVFDHFHPITWNLQAVNEGKITSYATIDRCYRKWKEINGEPKPEAVDKLANAVSSWALENKGSVQIGLGL